MRISQNPKITFCAFASLLIFKVLGMHIRFIRFYYTLVLFTLHRIYPDRSLSNFEVYTLHKSLLRWPEYIKVIHCGNLLLFIFLIKNYPNSNKQVLQKYIATVFINYILNHEGETCVDYRINYKHVMASLLKSFKPLWAPYPLSLNHVFLTSSLAVQNVYTITFVQTYL